jgi:outer membrane protein assembly factor BamA
MSSRLLRRRAFRGAWCLGLVLATGLFLPGAARSQDEFPSELKTVAAIRLEGRHQVSRGEIEAVLKTRGPSRLPWREKPVVRQDFLIADTLAIEGVYRQHGFLDTRVDFRLAPARRAGAAVVVFSIREGERSRIAAVELVGVTTIPPDALRKKLYARVRGPFNPSFMIVDTTIISDAYKERGYLPRVWGSARRDSLRVTVQYVVSEGRQYRNGEVYLSSPDERPVPRRLILRELLVRPGEVFRVSQAQRSVERLYDTGLLSQVQMSMLPDSSNTRVDFDLRVRSRKPRWIDAGVGSGTAERFRFTGDWGHRNLGDRGLQGVLASRLAFDGRAHFLLTRTEVSLLEPWLLHSRTPALATVYYENRHDRADPRWVVKQEAKGASLQLRREVSRITRIALTQDNTFVTQSISLLELDLPQSVRDSLTGNVTPSYTTHRLQLGVDRDARDHPINTTRGSAQAVTGEVAGGPLKGTSSFTKLQSWSSWYSQLGNGWVFATRIRAGAIDPFGRERQFTPDAQLDRQVARVPLEDRFRIGGVNSLRGYRENEIPLSGGLAVLLANAELRVPVVGPFGLELYVDAGNVWARPGYIRGNGFIPRVSHERLDPGDVRYMFGAGARVNLPFGPLRIDFTWSPRPDENGKWRVAEPQFAIGPAF